jgi:hypothetical protein
MSTEKDVIREGAGWLSAELDEGRRPNYENIMGAFAGHCETAEQINDKERQLAWVSGCLVEALERLENAELDLEDARYESMEDES